jgi:hypothetical protein
MPPSASRRKKARARRREAAGADDQPGLPGLRKETVEESQVRIRQRDFAARVGAVPAHRLQPVQSRLAAPRLERFRERRLFILRKHKGRAFGVLAINRPPRLDAHRVLLMRAKQYAAGFHAAVRQSMVTLHRGLPDFVERHHRVLDPEVVLRSAPGCKFRRHSRAGHIRLLISRSQGYNPSLGHFTEPHCMADSFLQSEQELDDVLSAPSEADCAAMRAIRRRLADSGCRRQDGSEPGAAGAPGGR